MKKLRILLTLCAWMLVVAWYINTGSRDALYKMENVTNWKILRHAISGGSVRTKLQRPNILFIGVDDLGEEISPYNKLRDKDDHSYQEVWTPNLERLASDSLVLAQAYNQYPLCNPSRSSLLTGRRPNTTRVYNLVAHFRKGGRNFTTIPQYFKENGYHTSGIGKVFHEHNIDVDPLSWSEPYIVTGKGTGVKTKIGSRSKFGITRQERSLHPDDVILKGAVEQIRKVSHVQNRPWFVAVGFRATHMTTFVPEEYMRLYPLENITVPYNLYLPAKTPTEPFPRLEFESWAETRQSLYSEEVTVEPDQNDNTAMLSWFLQWRQAYYASVSYVDASIGELLDELDRLGLSRNTIVVFWTDHGLILGEHGMWGKKALYDRDLRCPMMLRIPGLTDGGVTVSQLTEYVDLFPTLVEVAGLPAIGQCPDNSATVLTCHEGTSMVPLIHNPDRKWKKAAFSQVIPIALNISKTEYFFYYSEPMHKMKGPLSFCII